MIPLEIGSRRRMTKIRFVTKDTNITNGGEAALKPHAAGRKHKDRSPVTIGG